MKSYPLRIKTSLILALAMVGLALASHQASAQILMSTLNTNTYLQNFDGLASGPTANNGWTNNVIPLPGWYAAAANAGATIVGDATGATNYIADGGGKNTGAFYSYGTNGVNAITERALGSICSGTPINIAYGVSFTNDTANALTNFVISYTGEQWRCGGNTSTQPLTFFYRVDSVAITNSDATNTLSSGWTPVSSLDFVSPIATSTAGPLDGNASANRTAKSATISGLVVLAGQTIFFRWLDINDAGNDHALAIDELTVVFTNTTASAVAPTITTNPASQTVSEGESVSFTAAATGTQPLTYYWYSIISGATNFANAGNSVSLSFVSTNQSGNGYFVIVSNVVNTATSSVATLTVTQHVAPSSVTIGYLRTLRDPVTYAVTVTNNLYTIEGIVTTPDLLASPLESYFVQDATGGIDVFNRDGGFPMPSVGDKVRVTGPLMNYFGLLEMNVTNANPTHHVTVISSGNALPAAQSFDFSTIDPTTMEDSVEGSLMEVHDVFLGTTNVGRYVLSGGTIYMTNLTGQVFRLINPAACIDPQGYVLPEFATSVKGVISQYTTTPVPTNYYFMEFVAWSDLVAGTAPVPLGYTYSAGSLTLSWTDVSFTLQCATNVAGPYVDITGATSPFVTNAAASSLPAQFFRLYKP
jgi:hypothetical protein